MKYANYPHFSRWYGLASIIISSLLVFFQLSQQTIIGALARPIATELNLNAVQISFVASSFFYAYIPCQLISSLIISFYGPRKCLILALPGFTLVSLLFALAPNYPIMIAARILMGLFASPFFVSAIAINSHWLPARYFALAAGIAEMAGALGGMSGQYVVGYLLQHISWRSISTDFFVCQCLLLLLSYYFLIDNPFYKNMPKPIQPISFWNMLKPALKNGQNWWVGLYAGMQASLLGGFASLWGVLFLELHDQLNTLVATEVMSMFFIGVALGSILFGLLPTYQHHARQNMQWGIAGSILTFTLLVFGPMLSQGYIIAECILLGIFSASYIIAFSVARCTTSRQGEIAALGLVNMLSLCFGAPIIQPLIGTILCHLQPLAEHLNYHLANFRIALCPFFSVFAIGLVCSTRCRNLQEDK